MSDITLNSEQLGGFKKLYEHCKEWAGTHQAEIGVAEMALGVAAIAWGVKSGQIQFGTDLVGTKLSAGGLGGAAAGAGIGGLGAMILGSIGVAGSVTFGIPAVLLAGGGMAILGAAGYGIGDVAQKSFTPPGGFADAVPGASIMFVGMMLIVDGARRVVTDDRVLRAAASFYDGVLRLGQLTTTVVAKTTAELQKIIDELAKDPASLGVGVAGTAAGMAIGGSVATASVTVLGSPALGAVALSLGIVSAPVWPIIAGGTAGLAIGVAAWKGLSHLRDSRREAILDDSAKRLLSPPKTPHPDPKGE